MKDIAKRADVSVATVSYVLTGARPVSPERTRRVLEAVEELDYVPNASARGLRSQRTNIIGLALSDLRNPFYPDLANGCQRAAEERGYSVVIFNTDGRSHAMRQIELQLRSMQIDGAVIASATMDDRESLLRMANHSPHIVMTHRAVPGVPITSFVADNAGGARAATKHLIEQGAERIMYLDGFASSDVSDHRREGYLSAMEAASLSPWVAHTEGSAERSYNETHSALQGESSPQAIFASSDLLALVAMDAVRDLGKSVPKDVLVTGYDDLFFARSRSISLTSVHVDRGALGSNATAYLIDGLVSGVAPKVTHTVEPASLRVRRSTVGIVNTSLEAASAP